MVIQFGVCLYAQYESISKLVLYFYKCRIGFWLRSRRGSRVVRLLLEHQSDFKVLEIFKLPREKGVIIAIKQLRYTILSAVSLYIGRNKQFHIPNAFASLFHG